MLQKSRKFLAPILGAFLAVFVLLGTLTGTGGTAMAETETLPPIVDEMQIRISMAQNQKHTIFASANPERSLYIEQTLRNGYSPQGQWVDMRPEGNNWEYLADGSIYEVKRFDFGLTMGDEHPFVSVQWDRVTCGETGPGFQYARTLREDGSTYVSLNISNNTPVTLTYKINGESSGTIVPPKAGFAYEFFEEAEGYVDLFTEASGKCATLQFRKPWEAPTASELWLSLKAEPATIYSGETVTVTVKYGNNGLIPLKVSASLELPGEGFWSLLQTLAPGQSEEYSFWPRELPSGQSVFTATLAAAPAVHLTATATITVKPWQIFLPILTGGGPRE